MAASVTLFSQDKLAFASLRDKCLEYKTSECGLVRIALDVQWNTVEFQLRFEAVFEQPM